MSPHDVNATPAARRAPRLGLKPVSLTAACVLAAIAAGCGSSSSSNSSATSSSTSTTAATAKPRAIAGVAPKAGAVSAKTAGLKKLAVVPKRAAFSPHLAGIDNAGTAQAIPALAVDINSFWTHELANSGVQFPKTEEILLESSTVQDPCTNSSISPNDPAAYCGQSSTGQTGSVVTFYWTVPWMHKTLDTDAGHVNLAFDMAQFWSLYIQDLVGSTSALSGGKMTKAQYAQQNACLTGLYVRSLASRQLIEKGDTQTANSWVSALSASANGITAPDVTSAQLQQAFAAGFNSGDPKTCA